KVYYRAALPNEPCFAAIARTPFGAPVAGDAARTTLALPCYPELRDDERDAVVDALTEALG
ncbi:MAG TPA: DegT/DnrJ/EryC1/StrS family aminotransferase, partial [Minicystis sp.]|nr:DegT/DnrJ/EryC1/StrS family aminotransferase [Minicystis sp.]